MKKIIDIIFTFQGSIGGGFVRDHIINNELPEDLDVILYQKGSQQSIAVQLLRILSIMNYDVRPVRSDDVTPNPNSNNHYTYLNELIYTNLINFSRYHVYYGIDHHNNKEKINLDILILNSIELDILPVDFDCNLLFQNQTDLKLKHITFPFFQDYITMPKIIDRIRNKKFSLLPSENFTNDKKMTKQKYQILVERAINLVSRGYKMDDMFFPLYDSVKTNNSRFNIECRSFVVSYVKDLKYARTFSSPIVDSNCPLCLEKYLDTEIVINVSCLHTFHWKCPDNNSISNANHTTSNCKKKEHKGLVTWLQVHKNCPICRKIIIC